VENVDRLVPADPQPGARSPHTHSPAIVSLAIADDISTAFQKPCGARRIPSAASRGGVCAAQGRIRPVRPTLAGPDAEP